jgi:hypothetical protein
MCPRAEAVRGWRALNRPTVCTGTWLCMELGSLRLNEHVSQVYVYFYISNPLLCVAN